MPAPQSSKPRVVKDYEKLDPAVLEQIKLEYPEGFETNLVKFQNAQGDTVSALPFETEDRYYLVRMTVKQAQRIVEEDDDYDDEGNLRPRVQQEYEARHGEEGDELDLAIGEDDDDSVDELGDFGDGDGGTVSLDDIDIADPNSLNN